MRQDGSKKPHDWAEGQSDGCVSWSSGLPWEREPEFFSRIITGNELGILSTNRRQNAKVVSGTLHTLPVPRKREWANPKSNRCSFVFLRFRGSSTRNLCHHDKLSIKLFIGKSSKDSEKWWHVCDQALHALGCCTTTTSHVTRQFTSMNVWHRKHSCGS